MFSDNEVCRSIRRDGSSRNRSWRVALALAAAGALSLTSACSSGGDSGGDETSGGETSAAAPSDAVGAAQAWVKENVPGLSPDVVAKACEEGTLSLYSLIPPGIAVVNKQFEEDIPCVKVDAFQASGGALAERFTQEQQAGKHNADVIQNFSVAFLDEAADKGWLAEYTPPNAENVPEQWTHPGYWYGIGLDPMGVFWNTKSVTPEQQKALSEIKTWEDVFGIEGLKGKTGVVDIQSGGTAQLPLYFLQEKYGLEYWQQLEDEYDPVIFDSITPLTQRLASGNVAVALDAETTVPGDALQKGAPLQWVYPTPTVGVPQMLGVVTGAPHEAAAQLYMAWSLSQPGLAKWSSANLLAPIGDETPDDRSFAKEDWFSTPTSDTYYDADWAKINADLPGLTTKFKDIFK